MCLQLLADAHCNSNGKLWLDVCHIASGMGREAGSKLYFKARRPLAEGQLHFLGVQHVGQGQKIMSGSVGKCRATNISKQH